MPFDLTTSTNPPTKSDLFASDFKSSKKIRAHHQNAHLFLREETLEQFRERDPHGYLSVFVLNVVFLRARARFDENDFDE